MDKVVIGLVDSPRQAEVTVQRLVAMGFPESHVSVLSPDRRGTHDFGFERHTRATTGALVGDVLGGIVGAGLGLLVGLGYVQAPYLDRLLAAGPIVAALALAAVVGLVGALVGALAGAAVPQFEVKHYDRKLAHASILVGVHTEDRGLIMRAREVFRSVAASSVKATTESVPPLEQRPRDARA